MTGGDVALGWRLDDFDPGRPSPARVYDYWLGGKHNFAVDRKLATDAVAFWPELPQVMRVNRAFLQRAVRFLVSAGIRQFLDLGSGIPTRGNVHEVAQEADPEARVVYVDLDPVAVTHSRALLAGNESAIVVQADLRDPGSLLDSSMLHSVLDLNEPVAVVMMALLHFVPDSEDPAKIVAGYRDALAPGSYLALSHGCSEGCEELAGKLEELYHRAGTPFTLRSRAAVAEFFDGFELVEPGLAPPPVWRPDGGEGFDERKPFPGIGGVGRLLGS
ncbi:SAM-dependent methyltransferase [Amycolatopsis anabasis]|uniref:SAM-dependent methyltransferase n=1 Tax=Amycolatopsis anabasis TaxID=1840409 RepID=UPI00131E63F5|nr:SAM-dependent methyltransferase [Amycolatopsis anabasis]